MAAVRLTILNSMAGADFEPALDRHLEWGIEVVDLKDCVFGKGILDLSDDEARRAAALIAERGMSVHCLSTGLFHDDVAAGESAFRAKHLSQVDRAAAIARILKPRLVRLLGAWWSRKVPHGQAVRHVLAEAPWLVGLYREAVDRLADAGLCATIENEVGGCILASGDDAVEFFGALDRPAAGFTWDVQNMWQEGAFPSADLYAQLRPLIGYYHVKGGRADEAGGPLRWASALADASWPVLEITRQVVADGVSPVICLNPSHGERLPGYDYSDVTARDIAFLRAQVDGIV